MKEKSFVLPKLSEVNFAVRRWNITSASSVNQDEPHAHKDCEIYLNLSGDISFEVETHIYPILRGSVIITRPYEYHRCIYHSDKPHRHYWITFSPELIEDHLDIFYLREKGANNLIRLDEEKLKDLCGMLDELVDEEIHPLKQRIVFLQLCLALIESRNENYSQVSQSLHPKVVTALRYMDQHLTEDIDIQHISSACGISPHTLERYFKAEMNISPIAMLRKKRLIFSMEYLRSNTSVTEAAIKSGFSNYSNYIQLFRKEFGMTPFKFKKAVQAGEPLTF